MNIIIGATSGIGIYSNIKMGKWILLVILLIWALNYQEELYMTISHELLHTILSL